MNDLSIFLYMKKKGTLRMSLKQRPISFLLTVETATISLNVLGTPSCLQDCMVSEVLA